MQLHHLALEENRFLNQYQRVPDPSLLERHQALIDRLETSLASLRTGDAALVPSDPAARATASTIKSTDSRPTPGIDAIGTRRF